jgi:hypothetical protein
LPDRGMFSSPLTSKWKRSLSSGIAINLIARYRGLARGVTSMRSDGGRAPRAMDGGPESRGSAYSPPKKSVSDLKQPIDLMVTSVASVMISASPLAIRPVFEVASTSLRKAFS